jgi:chromosome transmission fidelity protein 1
VQLLSANDFIFGSKLDNVNLFKLRRHIVETNLVAKVGGYNEALARKAALAAAVEAATTTTTAAMAAATAAAAAAAIPAYSQAVRSVFGLISCLTNADVDGRIVVTTPSAPAAADHPKAAACGLATSKQAHSPRAQATQQQQQQGGNNNPKYPHPGGNNNSQQQVQSKAAVESSIRFLLLNPAAHFKSIVNESRSVILLGGTLQPFDYLASSLFSNTITPPRDMTFFSCGHVVDKSNVSTCFPSFPLSLFSSSHVSMT